MKRLLLLCIRLYQRTLSFDHGIIGKIFPIRFCRFYPSCSEYAATAIDRFGVLRGGKLALWRILKCHPWHPGGVDPLPEKEKLS